MAFSSPSSLSSGPSACLELSISVHGFPSSSSPDGCGGLVMRDLDINQVPALGFEDDEDDDESGGGGGGAPPRKKLRLTKEQCRLLEQSFRDNHTLNSKQKEALAFQLKLRPRQVEVWFQNRRARTKLKQTEMECEYLKRCFGSLTEENRRLQREVEQLRAMKVAPPTVLSPNGCEPLPASTLTMCPRCERVTSNSNNNNNTVGRPTPVKKSMSLFPTTKSHHMLHSRQPSAACQ